MCPPSIPEIRPAYGIETTQTLPSYFCIRTSGRCHILTKLALCNYCHYDIPDVELREWFAVNFHTVEIGYNAPAIISCCKCDRALSFIRLGTSCHLCTAKLNEFDQNPANINRLISNFDQNIVLRTEDIPQLPNLFY